MNNDDAREGEPHPGAPGQPNPNPHPTPLPPPIKLETVMDVLKIVAFVMLWYICSDANKALVAAVDYDRMAAGGGSLIYLSFQGAMIGVLQGLIMSVQALALIWASPTLFIYLGPVLTAFMKTPLKLIAEFRQALKPRNKDGSGQEGIDEKRPSSGA